MAKNDRELKKSRFWCSQRHYPETPCTELHWPCTGCTGRALDGFDAPGTFWITLNVFSEFPYDIFGISDTLVVQGSKIYP